ncbi:hypothetical protein GAPWK_1399 [Gilliamella apicola]|nr:hypothetical protein GAPWK_1399 [Gilliamella apicola]
MVVSDKVNIKPNCLLVVLGANQCSWLIVLHSIDYVGD